MTTTIKIHVNGRYRAIVTQDNQAPRVVEGNYEGSPNPFGDYSFYMPHPASSTFTITEEYVPEDKPNE